MLHIAIDLGSARSQVCVRKPDAGRSVLRGETGAKWAALGAAEAIPARNEALGERAEGRAGQGGVKLELVAGAFEGRPHLPAVARPEAQRWQGALHIAAAQRRGASCVRAGLGVEGEGGLMDR